jgi:small GTP-binding protein
MKKMFIPHSIYLNLNIQRRARYNRLFSVKYYNLQIWDTCGQEKFRSLTKNYFNKASLAIIIYAINSENSFKEINDWIKDLRFNTDPTIKMYLVGTKKDLESERKVQEEEAKVFANDNNFSGYIETSAENGFNCQKLFVDVAQILYENNLKKSGKNKEVKKNFNINHDKSEGNKKERNGCC